MSDGVYVTTGEWTSMIVDAFLRVFPRVRDRPAQGAGDSGTRPLLALDDGMWVEFAIANAQHAEDFLGAVASYGRYGEPPWLTVILNLNTVTWTWRVIEGSGGQEADLTERLEAALAEIIPARQAAHAARCAAVAI